MPPTVGPWSKVLYFVARELGAALAYKAFDYGLEIFSASGDDPNVEGTEWRRFVTVAQNSDTQDRADDAMFSFDIVNLTGGVPDSSWTQGDYDIIGGQLVTFLQAVAPYMNTNYTFTEVAAYRRAFAPYPPAGVSLADTKHFVDSGPPEHIYPLGLSGTGGGQCASQSCSTLTEITAVRSHWGRLYLPPVGHLAVDPNGRLEAINLQRLVAGLETFFETIMGSQFFPVVPTTQIDKVANHTLQTVSAVAIDNTLDVIRRRRFKAPTTRVELPLAAATQPADEPAPAARQPRPPK